MNRNIVALFQIGRLLTFILFLATASAFASAAEQLGPSVGSTAPEIGMPLDQTGKPRAFKDLTGPRGLVLLFFRSADWCPYCKAQLIDINGGVAEIEKRGFPRRGPIL
jgi:hypothetical protein